MHTQVVCFTNPTRVSRERMQTKQNKPSRQGVGSAKVLPQLLCLIHVVAWTSCHDGYMPCNHRLQSQPKGRPIHIIDKVAVMMQGGREATRGATLLTLAEKVTLAQGAIGGCRAPLLPRFSSIVCMLRGEPRAMGVTSQRKAKSTFSAGCCPRGLLNVAARLLR